MALNMTTYKFPQLTSRLSGKNILSSSYMSINECLGILLRTAPGELLGDPEYGCNLITHLFRYNNLFLPELLKNDILEAVAKFEPRISMNVSNVDIWQDGRTVKISLTYTSLITNTLESFETFIER